MSFYFIPESVIEKNLEWLFGILFYLGCIGLGYMIVDILFELVFNLGKIQCLENVPK